MDKQQEGLPVVKLSCGHKVPTMGGWVTPDMDFSKVNVKVLCPIHGEQRVTEHRGYTNKDPIEWIERMKQYTKQDEE